ncbi:E2F transcription factor-like E2FE [Olea europaea subsp. europaea]|uniref:E2F transcription factor-like E2FE n=1 Tax=Olea europaea subsp. europaea TaxID=158383 RepID=A0A8S0T140_OLEEU|nr:E2F transcription factor-like E2FE [Olea europaea subsp. europaea]
MALPNSDMSTESGSKYTPYCRKQKSLGLLCSNFLSLYNRDGVETIGLDDAASRLGVERRRIYDIVNVLESVGILARKAKNRYTWKGFRAIPKALQDLKNEGLKENCHGADGNCSEKVSDDDEDETYSDTNNLSQNDKSNPNSLSKLSVPQKSGDNRKEKSLGLLTQNFVKLFLCTDMELISLDDAAKLLLGDGKHTSMTTRTKVRRLYDIANVLSSMKFIEKIHHPETRKPAFRWLGLENGPHNESKKRVFGTDLTNSTLKRCKEDGNAKLQLQKQVRHQSLENEVDTLKTSAKSFQFGPFAPVNEPKVEAPGNGKPKRVIDWENLASTYRPRYHNQGIFYLLLLHRTNFKSPVTI